MHFLTFILLSFLTSFSPATKSCKGPCLTIIKATSQSWVAGIKNGGKGTNYLITCIANAPSDKLKVQKLWIGNTFFEVKAVRSLDTYPEETFSAGDTIFIQASRFVSPGEPAPEKTEPVPFKYKGEGLIGYRCGKKMKYSSIPKIEVLERLNMP